MIAKSPVLQARTAARQHARPRTLFAHSRVAAPMQQARIVHAKRAIYRKLAGLAAEQAAQLTLHSERHFLPMVADALSIPPEEAVEIGRWSGSTAQDADMQPDMQPGTQQDNQLERTPDTEPNNKRDG